MSYELVIEGPFDIEFEKAAKGGGKRIGSKHSAPFWKQDSVSHLALKQGCYVFALRAAKGFTPYYVGKATKGFKQEIFTPSKINHYNSALFIGKRGSPVMFFVTRGDHKKKIPAKIIKDLEVFLTQTALEKNPKLCNVQNRKNLPQWGIKGIIRGSKGKPTVNARRFRKMMNL